jgi:hypothetical protein
VGKNLSVHLLQVVVDFGSVDGEISKGLILSALADHGRIWEALCFGNEVDLQSAKVKRV